MASEIRKFISLLINNTSEIGTECNKCIYGMYLADDSVNIVDCYCPFPSAQDVLEARVDGKNLACPFFIHKDGDQ